MTYIIGDTDSQTIGDAESLTVGPVLQVSGELQVSGDLTVNNVREAEATAVDVDSATAVTTRIRELAAATTDADSSTAVTERGRELLTTATDTDVGQSDAERIRNLVAGRIGETFLIRDGTTETISDPTTASNVQASGRLVLTSDLTVNGRTRAAQDSDSGTTVYLSSTDATDPRAAIIELLERFEPWPDTDPLIKRIEDTTPKTRQNTTQPAIYVHKPVGDELTRFSAESLALEEDETVELYIYILQTEDQTPPERAAREYRNRVINALSGYMDDNYARTEFLYLEPSGATDARASTIARQTDHFVYTVEIDTHRLEQQL